MKRPTIKRQELNTYTRSLPIEFIVMAVTITAPVQVPLHHRPAEPRLQLPPRPSRSYFTSQPYAPKRLFAQFSMQRVLGRTAAAKRQAARRLAKQRAKKFKDDKLDRIDACRQYAKAQSGVLKEARLRRKEDWELGPIAPKRDVGDAAESYGTTDTRLVQLPTLMKKDRKRTQLIGEGDRVVIVKGRDQGKIGKVSSVDEETGSITITGLNLVCTASRTSINQFTALTCL